MRVFLDSSLLVYMGVMTNSERRGVDELFKKLLEELLYTNMLVIDEVLYVSRRYGVPYDTTLTFIKDIILPYTEIISVEEEDMKPFEKYLIKYSLKPSDAIHLATMEKVGADRMVTEDREFDKVEEVERIWLDDQDVTVE